MVTGLIVILIKMFYFGYIFKYFLKTSNKFLASLTSEVFTFFTLLFKQKEYKEL